MIEVDPVARRATRVELMRSPQVTKVIEAPDWRSCGESVHLEEMAAVVLELLPRQPNPVQPLLDLLTAFPNAVVLVFSSVDEENVQLAAMRAGARGFLTKDAGLSALAPAVGAVMRGEIAISRRLTMRIIRVLRDIPEGARTMRPVQSPLTSREWEILSLMNNGESTQRIADLLVLSEATVYSHVRNILRKLGVHTRAAALTLLDTNGDVR